VAEDEGLAARRRLYAKSGCGDHGWTEQSRRARLLAALALAPFGAAPLVARSKPNFHRNNDRKSECGMQGSAHCGLSRFSNVGGQGTTRALHNSPFVPQDKKSAVPTKAKRSEWKC
jgi:hypothetical protein